MSFFRRHHEATQLGLNGSGLPVVASGTKASDAFPVTVAGNSLAKTGADHASAMVAIVVTVVWLNLKTAVGHLGTIRLLRKARRLGLP